MIGQRSPRPLRVAVERPNNSFKPNLLRYINNMADGACHVVASATQVGLIQVLGTTGGVMGIFSGITNNLKKSEAAVVVQNLLEIQQRKGLSIGDPGVLANAIVSGAWDEKPHFFDGSQRQRPHKITIAAVALARYCEISRASAYQEAALSSLAMALDELHSNASNYDLHEADIKLIGLATQIFEHLVPEFGA